MPGVSGQALRDFPDKMAASLIYNFHKADCAFREVLGSAIGLSLMTVMVIARRARTCFVLAESLSSLYYRWVSTTADTLESRDLHSLAYGRSRLVALGPPTPFSGVIKAKRRSFWMRQSILLLCPRPHLCA